MVQQNFTVDARNTIWCTDFTYLYLANGSKRYNCTILDLHDRSVIASTTGREIDSALAVRTLRKVLKAQHICKGQLILHSDQGSQFASKEFTIFCKHHGVRQSMSRAGCPYDNAPMERYFNTLKNDLIYLHRYETEKQLYRAVEEFAYGWYNHVRPHSFNHYKTPFETRYAA